jgi:hypothetical protein
MIKIKGQYINVTKTHYEITIRDPYWGAWKAFGWPKGEWGMSLSVTLIKRARDRKKKIRVKYKERIYETTPRRIINFMKRSPIRPVLNRESVQLVVVPQSVYTEVGLYSKTKPVNS